MGKGSKAKLRAKAAAIAVQAEHKLTDGVPTLIFNEDPVGVSSDGSRAIVALADTAAGRAATADLIAVLQAVGLVTPHAKLGWAGLLLSAKGGKDQVFHYDFHQNGAAFRESINDPRGTCTRLAEDGTESKFVLHGAGEELPVEDALAWADDVLGDGKCVPQNPPPFHRCLQRACRRVGGTLHCVFHLSGGVMLSRDVSVVCSLPCPRPPPA
jgi:hypothetical protein